MAVLQKCKGIFVMDWDEYAGLSGGGARRKPWPRGASPEDGPSHRGPPQSPGWKRGWRGGCSTARIKGYALTEDGLRLLPHVEAAQAHLRAAEEPGASGEGLSGQIRLGAPDGCANYLLPQVIAQICAQHPALEVQIVALPRLFNLSRREADMAISVSAPQAGRLHAQKITDYHLHFAGRDSLSGPVSANSTTRGPAQAPAGRLYSRYDLRPRTGLSGQPVLARRTDDL